MTTTFKARYTNGKLEPLEHLPLKEGEEVSISLEPRFPPAVIREATDESGEGLRRSFGGWVGLVDCDELIRTLYEARETGSRPLPDDPGL